MFSASLIGIVNAWVADEAELSWVDPLDPAVSMPITWPWVLVSGPPESPGWIGALDWMSPLSRSELLDPSSPAVIARPRPVTLPVATEGVPLRPSALPMATTLSPMRTCDESPRFAVVRPEAPCNCSTAMSLVAL